MKATTLSIILFILKRVLGGVLIVLGLAALFTPLTPGSWLALIGLELIGGGFLIPKPIRRRMRDIWMRVKEKWWK